MQTLTVSKLYTPLIQALLELKRRRSDRVLMQKVNSYFSDLPTPPELAKEPSAIFARAVHTPNYEMMDILPTLEKLPIRTVFYEYHDDKFVSLNIEKKCLAQVTCSHVAFDGREVVTSTNKIVDISKYEGKSFSQLRTKNGESFVDFHHRLLKTTFPNSKFLFSDFSDWFKMANKFDSECPYLRYLGQFITDGILFEDFLSKDDDVHEWLFTEQKVIPAFKKLSKIFGCAPLIVPIVPEHERRLTQQYHYPESILTLL